MTPFILKLCSLMQRRRKEDDLRAELQFHLDEEAEAAGTEFARWPPTRLSA
jgi:hypothetical protein